MIDSRFGITEMLPWTQFGCNCSLILLFVLSPLYSCFISSQWLFVSTPRKPTTLILRCISKLSKKLEWSSRLQPSRLFPLSQVAFSKIVSGNCLNLLTTSQPYYSLFLVFFRLNSRYELNVSLSTWRAVSTLGLQNLPSANVKLIRQRSPHWRQPPGTIRRIRSARFFFNSVSDSFLESDPAPHCSQNSLVFYWTSRFPVELRLLT